ncbi:DNA polymerase domain-containing protein [Thermogemmatispora sp.]|uniref:DNA polymerase domain-containing protein n=1 Tax=Thermogemmatispora sp. TaxID=1968838 RepID=UPI0026205EDD|nr:DNA polymerase domain-containing protein [Thermogemmatispora sp.]
MAMARAESAVGDLEATTLRSQEQQQQEDEYLFGWNPTPGIVSVWANRSGEAVVWRREGERVLCLRERFWPWVLTTSLADLEHLGRRLRPVTALPPSPAASPPGLVYYRELDGPGGTYRFLLFCDDLSRLERLLLQGARRRLGRRLTSLAELEHCYAVGPVEQYLMQTGQVYFRGLAYEHLHRLQLDLETTALDPHRGRIFLAAVRDSRGLETTLEAPHEEDEPRLIRELCNLICQRDPDVIENHNLFGFDLPFLEERARVLGVPLVMGRQGAPEAARRLHRYQETLAIGPEARRRLRYSVAGRELVDTLDAVRRHDFVVRDMPSYALKDVARYFGIASAERTYIAGMDIVETYRRDPERVRRYALDDVEEVDGLSRRLLGAPFALASMAPRRYERLVSAGPAMGVLEPILVRSYLRAGAALPCPSGEKAQGDGLYEGGAVHLFATGVAEHVVKADVASLYPSLMRTFAIGPRCDRLGVLLSILGRLTDLRLQHKEAARLAPPGSIEANHHAATQAAMKILINAAYGYMGAGKMALFADSQAAAEVTRRGRAILDQVVGALRARGLALIEADTDGVYFAVPPEWDEEQERSLVAEIGSGLPPGIRLEYEGRYRAMFSHEVKNYALLTYDGRLIVHGVALRSSRAEPFGERFLRRALLATMLGKVDEVRAAYLETVGALRSRALPAADVATQVRLTKTPEAYFAARQTHQEPAYEALIRAGRRHWFPGERVRFYRTAEKQYVWLPDENTEEVPAGQEWLSLASTSSEEETPLMAVERARQTSKELAERRDYDVEYYIRLLTSSYAARLRKAFAPEDFEALFREDRQLALFAETRPLEQIQPRWIRCQLPRQDQGESKVTGETGSKGDGT